MLLKFRIYLFVFITALIWSELSEAQVTSSSDSLKMKSGTFDVNYDTSKVIPDSLLQIKPDSISVGDSIAADTTKVKKKKRDEEFKSKVVYSAKDSVSYSSDHSKFYLYGDVKVTYEDIELDAAYVEYDLPKNMVFASGLKDSTGQIAGKPVFKKGKESFKSETLYYDFKTKKGIIYNIVTEEEGGFLHAEKTKKQADGSIHIKNGKYTTCNLDHPHFYLALTKAVVIPDDKIVSGLAYLVVEDVPLPIVIPFGFFPNKRQATSGVLMPTFGQSNARGFSLENGGYYFALSQYFDVSVTGDIYSKGTWGVNLGSRYTVKYKFNGNLSARYYVNKLGVQGVDSGADIFRKQKDISITWSHAQDAKANPTSRFSASVNYSTTKFDQNQNYTNPQLMITSTKSSSISYNKSWTNFNLSVNLRHSQNSQTKIINMGLPSINFTANRIYPFKNKNSAGTKKWYENISINYTAQLDNNLSAKEDSFFKKRTLQTAQNGFRHSIPLSTNFKFLRYFNFTPSMNYTGMLYTTYLKRRMLDSLNSTTNKQVYYLNDTVIHSLSYAHGFAPTTSLSFNPSLYGMLTFGKNSTIRAIRHVMTPTVSFSFIPEIKNFFPDYNRPIKKNDTIIGEYSIYGNKENSYGPPPSCSRKSGSFSFGIGNNLEMKVKSEKDTVTGTKKIVLIQSFNISSGYNIYGEGNRQKLSNISMNGSTPLPLAKNVSINYNGTIDPFEVDSLGDTNDFYWKKHKGIGRLTNAGLSFGYTFTGGQKKSEGGKDAKTGTQQTPEQSAKTDKNKGDYNYFKIPWSFTFNYNLNYSKPGKTSSQVVQVLSFNGNFSLTPKWKVNFNSGYDFKSKQFSYTSFSIQRDLHCFVMSIDVSPFGSYRFYNFRIAALSSFLSDLKYEQRKDYYDYQNDYAY